LLICLMKEELAVRRRAPPGASGLKSRELTGRTRSSRRKLRAWESGDRDWVLESVMSVAEVGERHLACDTEVGREAHQGGAG
jgi:hypothetical protein